MIPVTKKKREKMSKLPFLVYLPQNWWEKKIRACVPNYAFDKFPSLNIPARPIV